MMQRKCRKRGLTLLTVAALLCAASVAAYAEETVGALLASRTTQAFTEEAVPEEDLTKILEAGLSATSAMNAQPWFFAVVTNRALMTEIAGSMSFGGAPAGAAGPGGVAVPSDAAVPGDAAVSGDATVPGDAASANGAAAPAASGMAKAALGDSPVAILVYMDESGVAGTASFDCGLACQNMYIAANALGYGAKIVSSPTMALNGDNHDALCEKLGVDPSLKAVAVLLIGKADSGADGVTGATARSPLADKVSFVD